jgi:hypothetical protein
MQETKNADSVSTWKKPAEEATCAGGRRRRALLIMPIMMVVPLCMRAAMWRSLKRIARKLDGLERRNPSATPPTGHKLSGASAARVSSLAPQASSACVR